MLRRRTCTIVKNLQGFFFISFVKHILGNDSMRYHSSVDSYSVAGSKLTSIDK